MFNMIINMVGSGMNESANGKAAVTATAPCLDMLDLAGYNYASGCYPLEKMAHPGRLIFGSETFPQDIVRNWAMVKQYPYLIGDFMWTAWDYIGEVGLGAWAYTKDGTGINKSQICNTMKPYTLPSPSSLCSKSQWDGAGGQQAKDAGELVRNHY